VEGPSGTFAKAIEIYNPTAAPIDLSVYNLMVFTNGSTTPSVVSLSGAAPLVAGDVYVLANPSSVAAVLAVADQLSATLDFNGNDMVVLQRGDTGQFVDAIGQVGVDPGAGGWGQPPLNTTDSVLRRLPSIAAGDSDPQDAFDPGLEWEPVANTDFSGLGAHAIDGEGSSSGTVNADVTMAAAAACLELSTTSISFGTLGFDARDVAASPSITLTNCSTNVGTLLARGSDATGPTAAWTLVDDNSTCSDSLGIDRYRLNLSGPDVGGVGIAPLGTTNRTIQSLAAGGSSTHVATIWTPCAGSSGDGETLTFQINYLATE
jgi:hypothetical protein